MAAVKRIERIVDGAVERSAVIGPALGDLGYHRMVVIDELRRHRFTRMIWERCRPDGTWHGVNVEI